jgi:transcriptional regulator with XRE-family HTH domain
MTLPRPYPDTWCRWPLSKRLVYLRKRIDISLSEAARRLGINKGHLWELEADRTANPRLSTLLSIARVYDVSIQTLTEGL